MELDFFLFLSPKGSIKIISQSLTKRIVSMLEKKADNEIDNAILQDVH